MSVIFISKRLKTCCLTKIENKHNGNTTAVLLSGLPIWVLLLEMNIFCHIKNRELIFKKRCSVFRRTFCCLGDN